MAKILKGTVKSTKMQNTIVVDVETSYKHPLYKKVLKKHKSYKVDLNGMEVVEGDFVRIEECRPLSKDKHFRVIENIQ